MSDKKSTNVFISYCHSDTSLVNPVVKLLRVNQSFVFQDIDTIRPGRKWRSELDTALARSELVVVFWCDHANHSLEVTKEWSSAVNQGKELLPLLLDSTPLPDELGKFQWIDFRETLGDSHNMIRKSSRVKIFAAVSLALLTLLIAGVFAVGAIRDFIDDEVYEQVAISEANHEASVAQMNSVIHNYVERVRSYATEASGDADKDYAELSVIVENYRASEDTDALLSSLSSFQGNLRYRVKQAEGFEYMAEDFDYSSLIPDTQAYASGSGGLFDYLLFQIRSNGLLQLGGAFFLVICTTWIFLRFRKHRKVAASEKQAQAGIASEIETEMIRRRAAMHS